MDSNGVLGFTPELFYLEMLLEPLEEQLYLPTILIKISDCHWTDIQSVGEEHKPSFGFCVPIDDPADFVGILLPGKRSVHVAYGIREYPRAFWEPSLPSLRLEVVVLLPSHDEVSPDALDIVKALEVVVAPVEDVEGVLFVGYGIHRLHVVDSGGSDVEEGRDLGLDVIQRMHLDSSLPFPEQRPFEDAQTQVDGC